MTIRVVICDDHTLFREAVANIIDNHPDMTVVAGASSVDEGIEALKIHEPDVAVIDVRLGEGSGIVVAQWAKANLSSTKVIMISAFASDRVTVDAYTAASSAFVLKQITTDDLLKTISDVASGLQFINSEDARSAQQRLLNSKSQVLNDLNPSDRHILSLLATGKTDPEIAAIMYLSTQTIRNRMSRLLGEFGLANRTQLALFVAQHTIEND
jgi:two-component system, NarL family, response regulator DevR